MEKDPQGSFFFLAPQVRGRDAESLLGETGLIGQFKKQLAERMFGAVEGPDSSTTSTATRAASRP
jgi:hypothetical protein